MAAGCTSDAYDATEKAQQWAVKLAAEQRLQLNVSPVDLPAACRRGAAGPDQRQRAGQARDPRPARHVDSNYEGRVAVGERAERHSREEVGGDRVERFWVGRLAFRARVERIEVGVPGEQQLVLFAQPVG